MRSTTRPVRPVNGPDERKRNDEVPLVIVPSQSPDAIQHRREIRDTFHDSQARTIEKSGSGRRRPKSAR